MSERNEARDAEVERMLRVGYTWKEIKQATGAGTSVIARVRSTIQSGGQPPPSVP